MYVCLCDSHHTYKFVSWQLLLIATVAMVSQYICICGSHMESFLVSFEFKSYEKYSFLDTYNLLSSRCKTNSLCAGHSPLINRQQIPTDCGYLLHVQGRLWYFDRKWRFYQNKPVFCVSKFGRWHIHRPPGIKSSVALFVSCSSS